MLIASSSQAGRGFTPRERPAPEQRAVSEPIPASLPAVIEPQPVRGPQPSRTRPGAALIAQLLASAENMPSARDRRREDPGVGTSTYRTAAHRAPPGAPRTSLLV